MEEIAQFLYREARLMDSHDYDGWFALWDEELLYWVPCNDDDIDPKRSVSIIYDRRPQLENRLFRLKGKHAFAQQPKSRLMRVVSNIEVERDDADGILVWSIFTLGDWRSDQQTVWFGRNRHLLRRTGDGLRMREKKVLLLNNDGAINNMTFLI